MKLILILLAALSCVSCTVNNTYYPGYGGYGWSTVPNGTYSVGGRGFVGNGYNFSGQSGGIRHRSPIYRVGNGMIGGGYSAGYDQNIGYY